MQASKSGEIAMLIAQELTAQCKRSSEDPNEPQPLFLTYLSHLISSFYRQNSQLELKDLPICTDDRNQYQFPSQTYSLAKLCICHEYVQHFIFLNMAGASRRQFLFVQFSSCLFPYLPWTCKTIFLFLFSLPHNVCHSGFLTFVKCPGTLNSIN